VSSTSNSALNSASDDANQNMSSAPAGSPCQSCGSAPESASDRTISPDKKHWIAIQLVDEIGNHVPGEDYRVTLPDGSIIEGTLDKRGRAKISGIDSGNCQVTFPDLDQAVWKRK
jgi:type VI secretion system secreted protein VgrG